MTVRAGLACCALAGLLGGCTQWVDGSGLRALSEPPYSPPGIVDVVASSRVVYESDLISGTGVS
ncbi:hypothetical protein [Mycolicibacterium vinylchloridicum]|uniref:hypothetical protein n=1 Tax=Mycolicibacterium vinylchloridicum TaxID=2736928 RepID=UPI0015CBAD1F|nr:hypothetical protein [Mycolicibacterium vinylchloridicum]